MEIEFRTKNESDNKWIESFAKKLWGGIEIISKDKTYSLLSLPGFTALQNNNPVGFIIYAIEGQEVEIVGLYSSLPQHGIGTRLIELVKNDVKNRKAKRLWLMTTNDNTTALKFYQKRGFTISAVRLGVMDEQRKVKPTIPLTGNDNIPIRDEIELELLFGSFPHKVF